MTSKRRRCCSPSSAARWCTSANRLSFAPGEDLALALSHKVAAIALPRPAEEALLDVEAPGSQLAQIERDERRPVGAGVAERRQQLRGGAEAGDRAALHARSWPGADGAEQKQTARDQR